MSFLKVLTITVLLSIMGAVDLSAREKCQTFQQEDGTSKLLCQDRKGRWIEQEGDKSANYHPLQKAKVVYSGTMSLDVLVPIDNGKRSKGIGGFLKSMLMQTVSSQSSRVRITVDYNGDSVSASVYDMDTRKTYKYAGTRSGKSCRISGSRLGTLTGRCTDEKFDLTQSIKQRDGSTRRLNFDVRTTAYTDLYKAELDKQRRESERQRLQSQCDAGSLEACTTLQEFGSAATVGSAALSTTSNAAPPGTSFLKLEPNQPVRTRGFSRWGQRVAHDFPSRAAREGMSGTVGVLLTVSKDGRVSNCRVSESSGHNLLDETACRNFTRYGRFVPATDQNADPIAGPFSTTVEYKFN